MHAAQIIQSRSRFSTPALEQIHLNNDLLHAFCFIISLLTHVFFSPMQFEFQQTKNVGGVVCTAVP
jgi:hypothetical protein